MIKKPEVGAPLTGREEQVLLLLAEGLTLRMIAKRMILSESTTKTYISLVFDKFNVHKAVEAVAVGFRLGYLE